MKNLFILLFLLFLSACFGSTPQSTFYMLTEEPGVAISNKKTQLAVEPIKIPAFLDKPQIVSLTKGGTQLNISETQRWAEPLSSMIQRVIINDLATRLPKSDIRPKTFTRDKYDYILYIDVNKMNASFNEEIILSVWWSLINKDGKTAYKTQSTFAMPLSDSYDDLVLKLSNLLARLSDVIAQKIIQI